MPSYEKSKSSGLWSVRFRETINYETHQKRLSGFKTKKEAQYGYEDYIKNRDVIISAQTEKNKPCNMLFDDLLDDYLKFQFNRMKPSSYYDMEIKINAQIRPAFTGKRIADITAKNVSDWINELERSYSYRSYLLGKFSAVIKYGEKYYKTPNMIEDVEKPVNLEKKKEMQIWTPEEFKAFYEAVGDETYKAFFLTLYILGCRRGEAMALTWADIGTNCIRINKSITNKVKGKAYAVKDPKNDPSIRTVAAPPFLIAELQKLKKGEYVFGGNRPLPTTSIDRNFQNAIKKAGLKRIRLHDLRHSCASVLISNGISIVAVSRQLGHKDIEMTLNTYSHLMPNDTDLIRNALADLGTKLGTQY